METCKRLRFFLLFFKVPEGELTVGSENDIGIERNPFPKHDDGRHGFAGIDTGDMLLQEKTEIGESETCAELTARLSVIGSELLMRTIRELENGTALEVLSDMGDWMYVTVDGVTGYVMAAFVIR